MKFICDHDLHIHTCLSPCSDSKEQTPETILDIQSKNGMKLLCLADHFWDSTAPLTGEFNNGWRNNDYARNSSWLPLPQKDGVKFLFGCEADFNMYNDIGLTAETAEKFDFIVMPVNHLHMKGFTAPAGLVTMEDYRAAYKKRLQILLDAPLPHEKMGLAHLTCPLTYTQDHVALFASIEDSFWHETFAKAAKLGLGIELNMSPSGYSESDLEEIILKPYRIAKEEGCRFYCGSDAHSPAGFEKFKANMELLIDRLALTEDDKYRIPGIEY